MDLTKKKSVPIVDEGGKNTKHTALLFGNNAAWHCVLCDALIGDRGIDKEPTLCSCGKKYRIIMAPNEQQKLVAVGVRALPMTAEDLAEQLTAMRERAVATREKEAALHLFGMRYASEMDAVGITSLRVATLAGLKSHFGTEIEKGKKLAKRAKIVKPL